MKMITIKEKWINAQEAKVVHEDNQRFLVAKVLPFEKISRNGVLYSRQSAEKTKDKIIGISLHHNHDTEGRENFPRGKWVSAEIKEDGLWAKAKIYDTTYNTEYIEWLEAEERPPVSLQINGDAESCKTEDGQYYQKAEIQDWLEISTVNVPGFVDAKGNFEKVMKEMLQKEDTMESNKELTQFKVGDKVGTGEGPGRVKNVQGNKIEVELDDFNKTSSFGEDEVWKLNTESVKMKEGTFNVNKAANQFMQDFSVDEDIDSGDLAGWFGLYTNDNNINNVSQKDFEKLVKILNQKGFTDLDADDVQVEFDESKKDKEFFTKLEKVRSQLKN